MRRRRYTDQDIIDAVKASFSIRQLLKALRLTPTGCNYKAMYAHIARLGLDTSHFTGQGHLKGKTHSWTPGRPLAEILVRNSTYLNNNWLKRRLLKEGLLTNRCYECGLGPVWRGKPLVMTLDHINGECVDHRIENLRLLCPNCNSQQETFAGRNKGRYQHLLEPRSTLPGEGPQLDLFGEGEGLAEQTEPELASCPG
jgi:hypothetical protein